MALLTVLGAVTWTAITWAAGAAASPNLEEALTIQRQLASERPADGAVLNDLGNLLALAGELAEAEEVYLQAVALEPERAAPRFNLALLLQQRGKREAAMRELREVIRLEPDNAWAHYQLGTLQEAGGAENAAVRSYARAFELDPNLSFPEVNPHVIENDLVLQAFLIAFREDDTEGAPRSFDEPGRIASLLAPVPPVFSNRWQQDDPEQADDAMAVEADGEGAEANTEGFRQPAVFAEPVDENGSLDESDTQKRVLTEDDLRPGRLNQASVPGRSPSGGTRARSTNSASDAARLRTWSRSRYNSGSEAVAPPAGGTPGVNGRDGAASSGRAGQPNTAPDLRTRFRPGLSSTGSLGTELIPDALLPAQPSGALPAAG